LAKLTPKYNLKVLYPNVAREWHPSKNKPLIPKNITPGSAKKVWWKCKKNHEWEALISERSKGGGCPFCSGRYASKENNLLIKFPKIAEEWHPTKNGDLTPKNVTYGSKKDIWWRCRTNTSHEWEASCNSRTNAKSGCPYCSGNKVCRDNNLQSLYPEIAKEWHPTKNKKLTPKDRTSGSNDKVWWKCKKGHEWKSLISSRSRGRGCPECSGHKSGKDNNLQFLYPEIVKEWHPTKNILFAPKDITPGSAKKVWWKCKNGHEWAAVIKKRALRGDNCPTCYSKVSKIQVLIFCELVTIFKDALFNKTIDKIERDIYLPKYKIAIEYDGGWYHNNNKQVERDKNKNITLNKKGIKVFRVRGQGLKKISSNDISSNESELPILVIKRLLKKLNSNHRFSLIQKEKILNYVKGGELRNEKKYEEIISDLPGCLYEDSLGHLFPEVATEWNEEKNKPLSPYNCASKSSNKVWWKCKKGHEWKSLISSRSNGRGCPECSGNKVGKDNNLFVKFPKVAKQWHPTKNGALTPKNVTPGSAKKIWWRCSENNEHVWDATVCSRTGSKNKKGSGCPECAGKVGKGNNLLVKFPKIAKELHPTKNGTIRPKTLAPGSHKKVWWICKNAHEWEAIVNARVGFKSRKGTGCPHCKNRDKNVKKL
jgi:hypothetical protein